MDVGNWISGSSSWITAPLWWRDLYNSVKLWTMLCRATQDRWVIVKSSDKTWSTGGGNENPLPYSSCKNPINSMKRQKKHNIGRWTPMSEGVQYATGEWQRAITNSCRKNEAAETKWKQCTVVDVSGGKSKAWSCKEQYCIQTWNVRSMSQGKLDVVKKMTRVNINILGISELKWMGTGEFNSDDHYIYYHGQEFHMRNRAALIVNKRIQTALLGCSLKNDRMILVHFQGKPFNITVIQVYAPTTDVKDGEADQFYEDLQDLLTPKNMSFSSQGIGVQK